LVTTENGLVLTRLGEALSINGNERVKYTQRDKTQYLPKIKNDGLVCEGSTNFILCGSGKEGRICSNWDSLCVAFPSKDAAS